MEITNEKLYEIAEGARANAYAPFSRFCVGAALLAADGEIYTGVNIENSSYGATICAERSAVASAVSDGCREFEAIAVYSADGQASPCGICRQVCAEFCDADTFQIILAKNETEYRIYTLGELLPLGFGAAQLKAENTK